MHTAFSLLSCLRVVLHYSGYGACCAGHSATRVMALVVHEQYKHAAILSFLASTISAKGENAQKGTIQGDATTTKIMCRDTQPTHISIAAYEECINNL